MHAIDQEYETFEVRRFTYRLPDIPKNFDLIQSKEFIRDLYNSTIIDESFSTLRVRKEKCQVTSEG